MKKRAAPPAGSAAATIEPVAADSLPTDSPIPVTNAWHREDPKRLSGEALRVFAHRQGMAKSDLAAMPDEKIRTQLHYIIARRYADEVV
ncbi:MAG: hypothetical protein HEQ39_09990 [Rhizobacter sp.]